MVPVQQEVRKQHKEVCSALRALALQVHQNKVIYSEHHQEDTCRY